MAGSSIWVFIEHGGSYAAPLALALLRQKRELPARKCFGFPGLSGKPAR